MFLPRTIFAAILAAFVVLAQPSPPAQGIQVGSPASGYDVRFPLTVFQCEPVFIYYSVTSNAQFYIYTDRLQNVLLEIGPVSGIGYLEWICNIPAGYSIYVGLAYYSLGPSWLYPIVVQPGSSSSCLGNITTTYQYATYYTTVWMSYTAISPTTTISTPGGSTVPFPTGSFSTITINPELIVATPTSTQPLSSHFPSPTRSASSRAPAIAGGVIGGLVVVAVAFSVIFIRLRKHRTLTRRLEMTDEPIATSPSQVQPGWVSNTSGPPLTAQYTSVPTSSSAIASTLDWDPSMLPVEVASTWDARQGEASLHTATTTGVRAAQTQAAARTGAEPASLHSNASVPAHPTPAYGTGAEPVNTPADTVAALDMFSRLPPERMRALLPILTDITASQRPSDGMRG